MPSRKPALPCAHFCLRFPRRAKIQRAMSAVNTNRNSLAELYTDEDEVSIDRVFDIYGDSSSGGLSEKASNNSADTFHTAPSHASHLSNEVTPTPPARKSKAVYVASHHLGSRKDSLGGGTAIELSNANAAGWNEAAGAAGAARRSSLMGLVSRIPKFPTRSPPTHSIVRRHIFVRTGM